MPTRLSLADVEGDEAAKRRAMDELYAARRLFARAQEEPSFGDWPYRNVVEDRLADWTATTARFAADDPANDPGPAVLTASWAACHRAR